MPHLSAADREGLILAHLELVRDIAYDYHTPARRARLDRDDLVQEGNLGLIRAADGFDPTRFAGTSFATYARFWIRAFMVRAVATRIELTGLDLDKLAARRLRPPQLVPLFPVPVFDPLSVCAHHGTIRRGSILCCMVCHASGMDDHPAFQRDAATDPRPEQKPAPPTRHDRETRKQRRLRLFADRQAAAGSAPA